ncbi:MAG: hypothetical protein ABJH98_16990 [Reichenbachiella sp.]|uniref:hypothetical protein n=1 Tax=Reichenbachiella sp. TaxID=2184521 RepID=UPI00329A1F8E
MMKSSSLEIPSKREQLLSKERKLVAELESDATEVESKLESTLKTLAIIGAGVLAVTILYKLATPESTTKKGKKKESKSSSSKPSAVTASVISIALQKLIPLAIEKFAKLNSKNAKDEKAAESTSK